MRRQAKGIVACFLALTVAPASFRSEEAVMGYRKINLTMPQTLGEALGGRTYKSLSASGIGQGCYPDEVVVTCDANVSLNMPKRGFWGSKLVLGPAVNKALLGIKMTTKCVAKLEITAGGIEGCVYEACLGYKKPIVMVCMAKGAKS